MIRLPPAFQFSQSCLQDFVDCPRRFQLRYLLSCEWPAPVAEPMGDYEQSDLLGKRFHKLIERHWLGVPVERADLDPILAGWWDAFVHQPPDMPRGERIPEIETSSAVDGQRLVAKFDLLAYAPDGQAMIVDWKTAGRRPSRERLDRRLQTVIYPFLLVTSSPRLLGYQIAPENVQLVYWFANDPARTEVFRYSRQRYNQDQRTITDVIGRVLSMDDARPWPLTETSARCLHCQYRSYCDRGIIAGNLDDTEFEEDILPEDLNPETTQTDDYVL